MILFPYVSVVYNASSNELVRTKTLVKGAIVQIDATPFRRWYENHYALPIGRKKATEEVLKKSANKKRGKAVQAKVDARKKHAAVDAKLEEQFANGRLYGVLLLLLLLLLFCCAMLDLN